MLFEFVKGMPKPENVIRDEGVDVASLLGSVFYIWIILQLFPVSA